MEMRKCAKQKNLECRIKCACNIFNHLPSLAMSARYETHQLMQIQEMKFRWPCLEILMKCV